MAEYTYADIIMDPNDPRLEGAIGKECYFSDYPKKLLNSARNNSSEYLDCLTSISKEKACPFYDKYGNGWTLIIVKKEEPKPEYVPFESKEEFVRRYTEVKEGADFDTFEDNLFQCGMWLKSMCLGNFYQVTIIKKSGIFTDDNSSIITWEQLLEKYTFLDGSPCGKEVKDE